LATGLITLTTDFGTRDAYVGAMKGVIASIAPKARVIDVSHEVPPQQILFGAFVLHGVWAYYPEGTIHVAVVDPGVGSNRSIILARYAGRYLIAPDNGLATMVHRHFPIEEAYVVENRSLFLPRPSSTFHGRDIMAPVAAHLANGLKPARVGRACERIELLPIEFRGTVKNDGVHGRVIYVDRFGNLVTNVRLDDLGPLQRIRNSLHVHVDGRDIGPLRHAYHEVKPATPLALVGSSGFIEIAVNCGSAVGQFPADARVRIDSTQKESASPGAGS